MRDLVGEKDKDTHINAMELLGLLAVVWTLGLTPSPCRGAAHCSRFYRWSTTGGPHAWLSACVARGTPTHCGVASWVSSGRCPSQAVCGFQVVWVVCEDVRCGVRRVAGGCLLWCGVVACSTRSVAVCTWGSPSSTSASTSCLSRPVLPWRLCGLSVGWVSCWT